MRKLYIIRKLILANSIREAQKLEKSAPIDEIYLEEQSVKNMYPMYPSETRVAGFKKTK